MWYHPQVESGKKSYNTQEFWAEKLELQQTGRSPVSALISLTKALQLQQ